MLNFNMVKHKIIELLNKIPYVNNLYHLNLKFQSNSCFPPGHYYSPIVSVEDLKKREAEIWNKKDQEKILGINLNTIEQLKLVKELAEYYDEMPFNNVRNKNRFYFDNDFYEYTDGIFLYSMMRHFKPEQIIEIGSGFSSALMLDTNQLFFNNKINMTFIEPYTDRLHSLITTDDTKSTTIIEKEVQSVPLNTFEKLNKGDILFVDSTHVAKTGSDVNYILFEILPRLNKGVLIHFHDIFYPFEYPKEWVFQGRNWNENYFLKSFLMYNNEFKIILFGDYLHKFQSEVFNKMSACLKNSGGNLWLEKL